MEVTVNTGDNVNPETGELINENKDLDTTTTDTKETDSSTEGTNTDSTEGSEGSEGNDEAELATEIDQQTKADNDAKQLLTEKGVNFDALYDEYNEKGSLSEESYTELEKAGFPKTVVDAYIAGKEAINDRFTNAIYAHVGGQAEYAKVAEAIRLQGESAVNAYNALVETGNLPAIKMYLNGVKATMVSKNGTSNPTLMGGQNANVVGGFETMDELAKAMSDSRYGKDDKYTNAVQQKAMKSQFFKYNQ